MDLDRLQEIAIEEASHSGDLEKVKRALEIIQLADVIADIPESRDRKRWGPRALLRWGDKRTAFLAVVITAFTFLAQAVQFTITGCNQRHTVEDSQWRAVIKSVKLTEAESLPGALNLETFYNSDRYGARARYMVAASIPYIQDENAFDTVFFTLNSSLPGGAGEYIGPVARSVALRELDLFEKAPELRSCLHDNTKPTSQCFRTYPSKTDENNDDQASTTHSWAEEAELRDWEIDSITSSIVVDWNRHRKVKPRWFNIRRDSDLAYADFNSIAFRLDKQVGPSGHDLPKPIPLDGIDLAGANFTSAHFSHLVVVKGKQTTFQNANFSNADLYWSDFGDADISGANFEGASVECSDLSGIEKFDGSRWDKVDIGRAKNISPPLLSYIQKQQNRNVGTSFKQTSCCPDPGSKCTQ